MPQQQNKPEMSKGDVQKAIKSAKFSQIEPWNDTQGKLMKAFGDQKPLIIVEGPAGTGKTYIPTVNAALSLYKGDIKSIVVAHPCEGAGNSIGFRPGDVFEKMQGWVAPVTDTLSDIFGKAAVRGMYDHDMLKIVPFEDLRGRSFGNSFILADECQNLTVEQMKLFLTRSQEGSQTVLMGDLGQIDIKPPSGLADLKQRIEENPNPDIVEMIKFSEEEVVRSELCKYAVGLYSDSSAPALKAV